MSSTLFSNNQGGGNPLGFRVRNMEGTLDTIRKELNEVRAKSTSNATANTDVVELKKTHSEYKQSIDNELKSLKDQILELVKNASNSAELLALKTEVAELRLRASVPGPAGKDGLDGADGAPGADGRNGKPGLAGAACKCNCVHD